VSKTHEILNELLRIPLDGGTQEEQLNRPWTLSSPFVDADIAYGGIFAADDETLVLKAQRGLPLC
jgi:hypothetical protein